MSGKSTRVPGYRKHSSGQARVTLDGKDHLLGPYGTAESKEAYRRLIAEWLEKRGKLAPQVEPESPLSVNELILAHYKFATAYYGFDRDTRRGDRYCLRDALRVVKSLYGTTPARSFGPLALKACRSAMVEKGWSRPYTNAQVDRVRRMFRWAAEEELLPSSVYQDLQAVSSLRSGRTQARETEKVRPVPAHLLDAPLPFMPPVVRAMVRLQLLTGCRPAEVCILRPIDLDTGNPACWVYRPGSDQGRHGAHKTAHHGHDRLIFIGPKAQEVLRPYLGTRLDAYCFCPAEAESARQVARRAWRKTPLYPSHLKRLSAKRTTRRRRAPGDRYDTHGYRRAIERACARAFPLPEHLAPRVKEDGKRESRSEWWGRLTEEERREVRAWRKAHAWSPNRLRHNRATELRPFGLDMTKTVLGHAKVETSLIYAEKDVLAAMELMSKIG
jgi:integrase